METEEVQTEVLQRITRVETKLDNMESKLDAALNANEKAVKALSSADSAHHRLDELRPVKTMAEDAVRKADLALVRLDRHDDDQKWFKRTFYGATITAIAGALVTVVWAALKLGGK
ncbi:hemolysin XhlA family protein [Paenibacillus zanthoxyli]|uniref:hemolysin XhlA family protein n=1 Tax=Paenibacillus zanthoxyli TaxID=369399 RepID=UPI000470537A|nr:hemolysin XhlA family protein [Paenibacillus zanthoxyli]